MERTLSLIPKDLTELYIKLSNDSESDCNKIIEIISKNFKSLKSMTFDLSHETYYTEGVKKIIDMTLLMINLTAQFNKVGSSVYRTKDFVNTGNNGLLNVNPTYLLETLTHSLVINFSHKELTLTKINFIFSTLLKGKKEITIGRPVYLQNNSIQKFPEKHALNSNSLLSKEKNESKEWIQLSI